jgi:hypothetical protein
LVAGASSAIRSGFNKVNFEVQRDVVDYRVTQARLLIADVVCGPEQ